MAQVLIFVATSFAIVFPVATFAAGVLRPHPGNPRYFTDDSGNPVYLTGSHTWPNLVERNTNTNPEREPFDFTRYVEFVREHKFNFIRLWSRHLFRYEGGPQNTRCYGADTLHSAPLPWPRHGCGTALDGKARFDLKAFNEEYFSRLFNRVSTAHELGIYVSVMLFGGWVERSPQCWRGNPFHGANNSNGINGDANRDGVGDTQRLPLPPGLDEIQKAYIRKVIDTVGAFDNVLFEVSNESTSDSAAWQYELVKYIKAYEAGNLDRVARKRHPLGITAFHDTTNGLLMSSPADWISPGIGPSDPYFGAPPAADGGKISILDSDHVFFDEVFNHPLEGRNWVWKSFMRGHNPILMENIFVDSTGRAFNVTVDDPGYKAARIAMGQTRDYANRINLTRMTPRGELASTGYVLANPGAEYLVYQPDPRSKAFTLDVPVGTYSYEWFDPTSEMIFTGQIIAKGEPIVMTPPFSGDAVLYLILTEPELRNGT